MKINGFCIAYSLRLQAEISILSDGLEDDPQFLTIGSFIMLKMTNDNIIQVFSDYHDK